MSRKKLRLAMRVVAALVFAMLCGELFARYYLGLGTPPLFVTHPTIEYLHLPNQEVRRFGKHFSTNAYGMRSPPFGPHKHEGELRVMVFGDSVVNGGALTDQSELATTLLARDMREKSGRDVVVGNIAAGSWGPGNWLAYAREYGFFEADVIVLVASSHDYGDNPTFAKLNEFTHPTQRPVSALVEGVTRYLPRYLPTRASPGAGIESTDYAPVPTEEDVRRALGDLRAFLEMARQQTNKVVVIQHFERRELEAATLPEGYLRIKMLCEELGITAVSLQPAFVSARRNGLEPYRDNIHLTVLGQKLLEEEMMKKVVER